MQIVSNPYQKNSLVQNLTSKNSAKKVRINYIYGFQGYESDDEVKGEKNSYTTEFRQYDPRIGRWLSLDPLAKKYSDITPYAFVANSTIIFIDSDGREIILGGNTVEKKETFAVLQRLTNDELHLDMETGKVTIMGEGKTQNSNKKLTTGTSLITDLINDKKHKVVIENVNTNVEPETFNGTFPDAQNGNGVDARIVLPIGKQMSFLVEDEKTGKVSEEIASDEIILGHELIHALHIMTGNYINHEKIAKYYSKDIETGTECYEFAKQEEVYTTGLSKNKTDKYTENNLRKEQGDKKRIRY